jgi:hypothetical protein
MGTAVQIQNNGELSPTAPSSLDSKLRSCHVEDTWAELLYLTLFDTKVTNSTLQVDQLMYTFVIYKTAFVQKSIGFNIRDINK